MDKLSMNDIICFNLDEYKHFENDEEFIFVSKEKFRWFKTSRTGFDILKLLDGKRKMGDVIEEIALDYQIGENIIKDDIFKFCEEILNEKLHKIENSIQQKNDIEKLKTIYIEITDYCNLECPFCNRICKNSNGKFMSFSEFKSLLEYIKNIIDENGIIYITGGEPCLHPQLIEILSCIKEKNINVFLCTNGTLLDEDIVVKLKGLCNTIIVSLDGSDSFANDKLVGNGTFELKNKSFNLLKTYNIPFMISVTPHDTALKCLPEIYKLGYSVGARSVFVNEPNFIRSDGKDISEYFLDNESSFEKIDLEVYKQHILVNSWQNNQLKQKEGNIKTTYFKDYQRCLNNPLKLNVKQTCGACCTEISISIDGSVYPCHNLHLSELRIGSIEDYVKMTSDEKISFLSNNVQCKDCFYWIFCLGGCKVKTYNKSKNFADKNPECEKIKSEYFNFLTSPLQAQTKKRSE